MTFSFSKSSHSFFQNDIFTPLDYNNNFIYTQSCIPLIFGVEHFSLSSRSTLLFGGKLDDSSRFTQQQSGRVNLRFTHSSHPNPVIRPWL